MNGFGHPQFPIMHPGIYSPGQMAFNNNPELSQLIAVFGGGLLGGMVGPGNFMPHMMPTQQLVDQFAMRNYQNQTRQAAFNIAGDNTNNLSSAFLGLRSIMTDAAPTDLNRAQADQMAELVNSPVAKILLGQLMGPENMEAMLHGTRGDVSALGAALSRTGYFRDNPMGGGRMNADALTSYTRAVYSELYEPGGNLDSMMAQAQDDDEDVRQKARRRLKRAAIAGPLRDKMSDDEIDATAQIVEDADVVTRLTSLPEAPKRVEELYKKYVQGGTETDTVKQAETLVKFDRAVKEADVLRDNETTLTGLKRQAEMTPVHEMHGFMAGQVGQIQEHMFQRGLMPKSLGRMSAEERIRTMDEFVNQQPLDEETTRRISREMAEKSLLDLNNASKQAMQFRAEPSVAKREEIIDKLESDFTAKIDEARTQIQKSARGDADAMTPEQLAELPAVPELAANVDGSRSAEAIKKYTGAVSAIRDIFGDNGNPNAPLPALLAALEGLTGGAVGSMRPQQIESTLRQMQSMAKEAGIGFEQMAMMSTQIDAQAAQMGLTPSDAMRIKPAAMAAIKTMQDTGAFSNPIYGQLDRGASMARTAELITAGAASGNAKALGALESIFRAGNFKEDSEIALALKAAQNMEGDGSYTYIDPKTKKSVTRNIREDVGRYGESAIISILDRAGVDRSFFAAQYNNPANLQFVPEMFGYLTQRASVVQELQVGAVQGRLDAKLDEAGALAGVAEAEQTKARDAAGQAVAGLILEHAGLDPASQRTAIQKDAPEQIKKQLMRRGFDEATADTISKNMAAALQDNETLNAIVGDSNTLYSYRTGGEQMSEAAKRWSGKRDALAAAENARQLVISERRQAAGVYYESAPLARFSDYLRDIGNRGENFTISGMMDEVVRMTSDRDVFRQFYQESEAGINVLGEIQRESSISRQDIDAAVRQAEADPANAVQLKKLIGVGDDTEIVTAETAKEKVTAALKEKDTDELAMLYNKYSGTTASADIIGSKDKLIAGLQEQMAARTDVRLNVQRDLLSDRVVSVEEAARRAAFNLGSAREGSVERNGKTIQYSDLARYREQIEAGMLKGDEDSIGVASLATLKAYGAELNTEQQEKLSAALNTRGEEGAAAVKALKEDTEFLSGAENRDKMFTLFETLQKNAGREGGRVLGLDAVPSSEDFFPPDSQQRFAEAIAKAIKEALYPERSRGDNKTPTPDQNTGASAAPAAAAPAAAAASGGLLARAWQLLTGTQADKPLPPVKDEAEKVTQSNDANLAQSSGAGAPDKPAAASPEKTGKAAVEAANDANLAQSSGAGAPDKPAAVVPERPIQQDITTTNDESLAQSTGLNSANIQPGAQPKQKTDKTAAEPLAQAIPDGATAQSQQTPRQLPHSLPANLQTVHANQLPVSGQAAGGASGEVKLRGVLEIRGLQEAILDANGTQVIETGGAPVIFDGDVRRTAAAAQIG